MLYVHSVGDWTSSVSLWGVRYDSTWPQVMNWGSSRIHLAKIRLLSLISYRRPSDQCFSPCSLPREANRGKSVKLEVDGDKRTKGLIFTPRKWQSVCLLTPFPKRNVSMSLKKATSPLQGWSWQHLCGWVSSRHCRKKGSSVTLDDMPVPAAIRAAWGTNSHSDHRLQRSVQSPHGPPHQAKRQSDLESLPTESWKLQEQLSWNCSDKVGPRKVS